MISIGLERYYAVYIYGTSIPVIDNDRYKLLVTGKPVVPAVIYNIKQNAYTGAIDVELP
jgi:hypothetical protein